jgi:hypothetical protein
MIRESAQANGILGRTLGRGRASFESPVMPAQR